MPAVAWDASYLVSWLPSVFSQPMALRMRAIVASSASTRWRSAACSASPARAPSVPRSTRTTRRRRNRDLLALLDCRCLIFQAAFAPLVAKILPELPQLTTLICLDGDGAAAASGPVAGVFPGAISLAEWLAGVSAEPWQADPADDVVMLAGTGGAGDLGHFPQGFVPD